MVEEAAWVRHCNEQREKLERLLGREATIGEWLARFNLLVERWK